MEICLTGKRRHILSDKEEFLNIQKRGGCLSLWKDSSLDNHLSRISLCSEKIKLDQWFQLFWKKKKNPVLKQKLKSDPHIQNYHQGDKSVWVEAVGSPFSIQRKLKILQGNNGKTNAPGDPWDSCELQWYTELEDSLTHGS